MFYLPFRSCWPPQRLMQKEAVAVHVGDSMFIVQNSSVSEMPDNVLTMYIHKTTVYATFHSFRILQWLYYWFFTLETWIKELPEHFPTKFHLTSLKYSVSLYFWQSIIAELVLLTLGTPAQRGLRYLICNCVCLLPCFIPGTKSRQNCDTNQLMANAGSWVDVKFGDVRKTAF